ncbi:hypothetical protein AAGG60_21010, partial [Stenotrophomonas maltophilia]
VPTLLAALAAAGTVYLAAGDDLYNDDDDGGIRPDHQEAAVQAVARVLGDRLPAESFIETLRDCIQPWRGSIFRSASALR